MIAAKLREMRSDALCILVSLALVFASIPVSLALDTPGKALGKGEEGDWSLRIKAVDATEIHYQSSTGLTAYCYRFHTHGPDEKGETYTHIQRAKPAADYIYAKGYPGHTTINGKKYSKEDAWRVTVYATWIVAEYTDGYGVSWDRAYANGYRDLVDDAKEFAKAAKAYKGGDDDIDGTACVVYVDGKSEIQPMLIGNQFGHLRIEKSSTTKSNASLAGAVYGIFEDEACKTSYHNYKLTTDEDGIAYDRDMDIVPDIYYVKELAAPDGFKLDDTVHKVKVKSAKGADQDSAKFTTTLKVTDEPQDAKVKLRKASSNKDMSNGNGNYSLEGAKYELYATKSDALSRTDCLQKFTTKADGSTDVSKELSLGTYYLIETKPSEGFAVDPDMNYKLGKAKAVKLSEGDSPKEVTSAEPPKHATIDVMLTKKHVGTAQNDKVFQPSVAGARFRIDYYETAALRQAGGKPKRSWTFETGENGRVEPAKSKLVAGDKLYTDSKGAPAFPLGAYRIVEVKAPKGYVLPSEDRDEATKDELTFAVTGGSDTDSDVVAAFANAADSGLVALENPVRGGIAIGKADSGRYGTGETDGAGTYANYAQGDATLKGAVFSVYNRSGHTVWVDANSDGCVQEKELHDDGDKVADIESDYDKTLDAYIAKTPERYLPFGTYEVKETKAPKGYKLDEHATITVSIDQDGSYDQFVYDKGALNDIVLGGVLVKKADKELGAPEAIGGIGHAASENAATLEGIEFTVRNASEHGVFVAGSYHKPGDVVATLVTAWDEERRAYIAQTASHVLPYGTYEISETKSNDGYLLTDGAKRTFEVRGDGEVYEVDTAGNELVWNDQVRRNDFSLKKKAAGVSKLPDVVFKVTNVTTGESHVIVTDRNGIADSASTARQHTDNTNANDRLATDEYLKGTDGTVKTADIARCGTWFGLGEDGTMSAPDDSLAALPYGLYRIDELRCEANEGYQLWSDTFFVDKDAGEARKEVDLGTVDDDFLPEIGTSATDAADGNRAIEASGKATIVDEVSYEHLSKGTRYLVEGTLVSKETAAPLVDADGAPVTAKTEFTAKASSGTVDVRFEFDTAWAEGAQTVVFEKLRRADSDEVLAVHEDLEAREQTIDLPVAIGTELVDASDGDHFASGDEATLVDRVSYTGLTAGKAYTLHGVLMRTSTASPLEGVDGAVVEATCDFTPKTADGTVELSFSIDPSKLEGDSVVAFETLVDASGSETASHRDITDEGQTVHIPSGETSATDQSDGDKFIATSGKATIVDRVSYRNLVPGEEYEISGTLMDKESGSPVEDASGKAITATTAFVANKPNGMETVVFAFDAAAAAGKTLVAFETVTSHKTPVFTHKDLDSEAQSVRAPKIATTLTDSAGKHTIASGKNVVLTDKVSYAGLKGGEKYTVKGTLMSKSSGKALTNAKGKALKSTATFTARDGEGSVDVVFKVDTANLAKSATVAFEELADETGTLLAEHKDLDDASQTVSLTHTDSPVVADDDTPSGDYAKTGSDLWPLVGATLMLIVGTFVALGAGMRARTRKRSGRRAS